VVAGVATAVAVLAGALAGGQSVRASLRDLLPSASAHRLRGFSRSLLPRELTRGRDVQRGGIVL